MKALIRIKVMPRLSIEARRRIVSLYSCRYSFPSIVQRLEEEKVAVSKYAVYDLVKKFHLKGVVKDLPRRKKARILTDEIKKFIEEELQKNDELEHSFSFQCVSRAAGYNWPVVCESL